VNTTNNINFTSCVDGWIGKINIVVFMQQDANNKNDHPVVWCYIF
jgi:hypothetical protein